MYAHHHCAYMKTERLIIRLSPEQKAELWEKARNNGQRLSEYVLQAALGTPREPKPDVRTTNHGARTKQPDVRTKGSAVSEFFSKR